MRFREIFRFELAYQFKRASTWLFLAILFLFGAVIIRSGSSDTAINAPSIIALFTVFSGAIWLIIGGAIAGDAGARDAETLMDPLMYSAPIRKAEYLGGRFLAALLINALVLLMAQVGELLSTYLPGIPASERAPFRAAAYLTAYGFIILPNVFVVTAIQFAAALRSRRANRAYLASVFILIVSHLVSSIIGHVLDSLDVTKMLDMLGLIGIIGYEIETWTPLERQSRLITLEGVYLANRLIWTGIGVAALVVAYRGFHFAHAGSARTWAWRTKKLQRKPAADRGIAVSHETLERTSRRGHKARFDVVTYLRQIAEITLKSFRTVASGRAGILVVLVGGLIIALFMPEYMPFMGVPMIPRTDRVLGVLTAPLGDFRSPWIILPLLTVFYAGELVWRERAAGISELVAAAPVPESALLLGKFLGLGLVLAAWMTILIAAGMLGQLMMGYHEFELSRYVQAMLGLQLADYLLFALLALVVQVAVNNRYTGQLAALLAYGLILFASQLGIRHHMLVYASDPGWGYSNFRGFGATIAPWAWFKLYWTAWAILLAVVARVLWVRSRETGWRARFMLARSRLTRSTVGVLTLATLLLAATGGFTFYNTNIRNTYRTSNQVALQQVEYERRYGKFERVPKPNQLAVTLQVDLYPSRRSATVKGSYRLVNRTTVAIDTIHVATMASVSTGAITFDRPARNAVIDDELGHRIYVLDTPLQPHDSLQLNFDVQFSPHGFANSGYSAAVVPNATYVKNQDWLPAIGYQPQRALTGESARRKHGLAPRPRVPSLYDSNVSRERLDAEQIMVDAIISTEADQTALAPGLLTRSWSEGGRRFFHYKTDAPIGNEYSFFSANYRVQKDRWNDVAIELYYHPRQPENADRMVKGVKAALDYYTREFGPYPYRLVRFVARPGLGVGMHADASTIDFSEGAASVNPNARKRAVDLTSMVVAHEVSHQWWGTQVFPAYVEGAGLLGEGLANYSALRVIDRTFGAEQVELLLSMWRQMYEEPRSRASTPLLQAADQFASYRKGPFAMHTLSQYIGDSAVNVALRRVVQKHGSGKPPLPTSLDLYAELKTVTPDTLQWLLHDLFEQNTFWELTTSEASMAEKSGQWQVTMKVNARKAAVDTMGVEKVLPMNDWVEFGVYESDSTGAVRPTPLYLQKHLVRSGQQTITVSVPRKPSRAGIDPRFLLLGRAMENNVRSISQRKDTGM